MARLIIHILIHLHLGIQDIQHHNPPHDLEGNVKIRSCSFLQGSDDGLRIRITHDDVERRVCDGAGRFLLHVHSILPPACGNAHRI